MKQGDTALDGIAARGQPLVRQRFPRRQHRDRVGADQLGQRGGEILGLPFGGGHGEHSGGVRRSGERGERQRTQRGRALDTQARLAGALGQCAQARIGEGGGEQPGRLGGRCGDRGQ